MLKRITALILCAALVTSTAQAGKFDFLRGLGKSSDDVARQADEVDGGGSTLDTLGDAAGDAASTAAGYAIDAAPDETESETPDWIGYTIVAAIAALVLWQLWSYLKSAIAGVKWITRKLTGGGKGRRRG